MPIGYAMSTERRRGRRGGWCDNPRDREDVLSACVLSNPPTPGPLDADVMGPGWCGLDWSLWVPATTAAIPAAGLTGLYRIRNTTARASEHAGQSPNEVGDVDKASASGDLIYIGEGTIRPRIAEHLRKGRTPGHPQREWFSPGEAIEVSWTTAASAGLDVSAITAVPPWTRRERLEIENDLVGAFVLARGRPPQAQFRGD
jgi:hypothetical protein